MCIFENLLEKFSKAMLKRNKGMPFQINIPQKTQVTILHAFNKTKQQYTNTLSNNMSLYMSNKITQDDYLNRQKVAIKSAFSESYRLGKWYGSGKISDLDDNEKRFSVYQTTKEMQFMTNFSNDIKNSTGKMPYTRRMKMYSDSLTSMFGFGRLVYLPDDIKIIWQLGNTDKHCLDCLMFVANNPYTKRTLPGYPKSGASRCLSNCRCSLIYIYNNQLSNSDYDSFIVDNYKDGMNIPSEEQYININKIKDTFYYNRLMFEVTKDVKYKELYLANMEEIKLFKNNNKIDYKINFLTRDIINDVKSFNKNKKFRFIQSASYVSNGSMVSTFIGNKQVYAKVINISGTEILVKGLNGEQFFISHLRNLIFEEI